MANSENIMLKGKTASGFEFEIPEEVLDDYELFEIACEVDENNSSKVPKFAKLLLGDSQYEELKKHLRNENGRISTRAIFSEITEIFASNKETKNC